jgi:starch phosphorylase
MKAACNGVLNISVPDGWWAEAFAPGLGFQLGEQQPPDAGRDAGALYELLEQQLVPMFYERDADGLPRGWISVMRASMSAFLGRFSTRRMLGEYARMYGLSEAEPAPTPQPVAS